MQMGMGWFELEGKGVYGKTGKGMAGKGKEWREREGMAGKGKEWRERERERGKQKYPCQHDLEQEVAMRQQRLYWPYRGL